MRAACLSLAIVAVCHVGFAPLVGQDRQGDEPRAAEGFTLKTAETIEFSTDEVTWMQVDVSPDGRSIVFDLLGDLYTLPIAGGTATQLTRGMMYDAQPRFSPDGRFVVFTSDRDGGDNVWTIDVNSKATKQITKGKTNRYRDRKSVV